MAIEIEKEVNYDFGFDENELIERVINKCVDYVDCPYEVSVEVTLTNNETIKTINNEFREIDKETDVLSFPMLEYEEAGNFDFLEKDDIIFTCFDPETGELILGDIIISVDKMKEQAKEYGHSTERELAFLVAHSMFHLFGYDHMEDDEREIMENKQKEVLSLLKIER